MARPDQQAIQRFMKITGVSEAVAVQKLEKFGDVIDALSEHFNEGDGNVAGEVMETPTDVMDGNQSTPQDEQTNKILSDTSLGGNAKDDEQMKRVHLTIQFPRKKDQEIRNIQRAMSLSIKTAEQEAQSLQGDVSAPIVGTPESSGDIAASNGRLEAGRSLFKDEAENANVIDPTTMSSSGNISLHNRNAIHEEELGGISSAERNEALMLEAIMFGGIPEGSGYGFPNDFMQNWVSTLQPAPCSPSPSLSAQRLTREQQDGEHLKSLKAEIGKKIRELDEAKAALEEKRRREEGWKKKLQEAMEFETRLAAKEAALPTEPSSEDENAVTLQVEMQDGSHCGRRFLRSDRLQSLFDFIDIGRAVKPGTYRLVRQDPRRAISDGEGALSLNEVGLTKKQEVLCLELI